MRTLGFAIAVAALIIASVVANEDVEPPVAEPQQRTFPLILLTKTASAKMIVLGSTIEVTVVATNVGKGAAYNVVVQDAGFSKPLEAEKLEAGEKTSTTYTVTPTELGMYSMGLSTATYQADVSAPKIYASSNAVNEEEDQYVGEEAEQRIIGGYVAVVTSDVYERANTRYIKESIAYLFLGGIIILFPFFMYRMKQADVDKLIRRSKLK